MRITLAVAVSLTIAIAAPSTSGLHAQTSAAGGVDSRLSAISTEIRAAEERRIRGDSAAWALVAPGFFFTHSTGDADDLKGFLALRAGRAGNAPGTPGGGVVPGTDVDLEPPVERLVGEANDVYVRTRLIAAPSIPGIRPARARTLDVYVRRDGRWLWLGHSTTQVEPRRQPLHLEASTLAEYAGGYTGANGRRRTFAIQGDTTLTETTAGPVPVRGLLPLSESTFGFEGASATITFVRDRAGKVVAAEVSSQNGFSRWTRAP